MSVATQPAAMPTRPAAMPASPVMIAGVLSTGIALSILFMQISDVGPQAAALIAQHTGLARAHDLKPDAWASILLACSNDVKCSPWLHQYLAAGMAGYWFALLLPLIVTPLAAKFFPKPRKVAMKDPGMARWEIKARMTKFLTGNAKDEDPFVAFMGYLKAGKDGGSFETKDLPPLWIPREMWCQNTLVWGGIGSGKTTAFFQPNIFLAAHLGLSCVVFDVKWPQKDSGFFETIGYWHALGRRVVLLTPFEAFGARVNMLRDVHSFSDALEKADEIYPPPEFQVERGQHYNDKKRFGIAALMWLLRTELGDAATMRHVLDYAMMPEDRLMGWIEQARDEQAKSILLSYKDAGQSAFSETRNGIISALKIFFNASVVHATSGSREDTVDLEECFRQPTLIVVGINGENNLDGSGEVLFRLYKRLIDRAAMRVAREQGGKLWRHLAIFLDEKANIGRLNYMIRSMSLLRSFNISHHLGIQNEAQNKLVDGELYWEAMSTNVIARTIMFPRGITGEDAIKISDTIGKTTASAVTVGGSRGLSPLGMEGSNQASASLTPLHLLSTEEFPEFSLGEAVVKMNGQHPIRVQLVPMNMPYVQGTGLKPKQHPNVLYQLYHETLQQCPGGLIKYTNQIIRDGLLVGSPKKVAPTPNPVAVHPGMAAGSGAVTSGTADAPRPSDSTVPVIAPGAAIPAQPVEAASPPATAAALVVAPVSSNANLSVEDAYSWVQACMDAFVEITLLQPDQTVSVRVDKLDPAAVNSEAAVSRLFIGGLVELNRTRMDAHLSSRAQKALPRALLDALVEYVDARPTYAWLQVNAAAVDGTPERAQHVKQCEAQASEPLKAVAQLEGGFLLCPRMVTREMFRASGTLRFAQRRVGTRDLDLIPVSSWADTAQAVRAARATPEEIVSGQSKPDGRRSRKKNTEALINAVLVTQEPLLLPQSPAAPESP